MPWEVGKMLLQVQWIPREAHDYDLDADTEDDDDAVSSFSWSEFKCSFISAE